jgi:hypothetical protein
VTSTASGLPLKEKSAMEKKLVVQILDVIEKKNMKENNLIRSKPALKMGVNIAKTIKVRCLLKIMRENFNNLLKIYRSSLRLFPLIIEAFRSSLRLFAHH